MAYSTWPAAKSALLVARSTISTRPNRCPRDERPGVGTGAGRPERDISVECPRARLPSGAGAPAARYAHATARTGIRSRGSRGAWPARARRRASRTAPALALVSSLQLLLGTRQREGRLNAVRVRWVTTSTRPEPPRHITADHSL